MSIAFDEWCEYAYTLTSINHLSIILLHLFFVAYVQPKNYNKMDKFTLLLICFLALYGMHRLYIRNIYNENSRALMRILLLISSGSAIACFFLSVSGLFTI